MSRIVELNLRPDRATLRNFGWIALVGFSLLALCAWREWLLFSLATDASSAWFSAKPWVVGALLALGGMAGVFSALYPPANRPIYVGLALVAFPIGFVLSYLILGALFIIVPIGVVFRLFGRDLMQRRYAPEATSYWVDARPPRPPESYFRQF